MTQAAANRNSLQRAAANNHNFCRGFRAPERIRVKAQGDGKTMPR
jgi:hypothetical protein